MTGVVEQINFRTIVLRDVKGSLHIFENGDVNTLSNHTHGWSGYVFDIGVAYKENIDRVLDVLKLTGKNLQEDGIFGENIIEDIEIFGVDRFDESAIIIKGRIKTKPGKQFDTGREFLKMVKKAFDENNIEIPFPNKIILKASNSMPDKTS
jgi:small conductance mechanosensitive channel